LRDYESVIKLLCKLRAIL